MELPKLKKPTKRQVWHFIRYAMCVIFGNAITAVGSVFFVEANHLTMGGTTGIGIFVRNLLHGGNDWIVSTTVYIANISLFIIGTIFLGKKFALATLAGTLLYPSFMRLFESVNVWYMECNGGLPMAAGDPMLAVICGSLLIGAGIGMVVRVGASTGGTDIPPLILYKYFGVPVSVGLWALDGIIVCLQLFGDITFDTFLYGILITLLSSAIVDVVSLIGSKKTQVKIVSRKYKEIREMILNKLDLGVTLLYGETGFLKEKCYVLLTVVSKRDLVKLKNAIQAIDPEAFLTISTVSEVRGRGFSSERISLPKSEEGQEDLAEVPPEEKE